MDNPVIPIYFDEEKHLYYDDRGIYYTSVTSCIGKYKKKFDKIKHSENKAIERIVVTKYGYDKWNQLKRVHKGYENAAKFVKSKLTPEQLIVLKKIAAEVREEWGTITKASHNRGNAKHSFMEYTVNDSVGRTTQTASIRKLLTLPEVINNFTHKVDIDKLLPIYEKYPEIYTLLVGLVKRGFTFYAEIGVFSVEYLVSGLIDLFAVKGKVFYIIDWKTNKDTIRKTTGYYKKVNGVKIDVWVEKDERFLKPINHLQTSKFNEYSLQLSMYAHLAELFGFNCMGLILCHIRPLFVKDGVYSDKDEVVIYNMEYYKEEIKKLLIDNKCKPNLKL